MTPVDCAEMRLLIQADVDCELMPADTAGVEAHLERCAACATMQSRLLRLSAQIRQKVPHYAPPEHLIASFQARIAAIAPQARPTEASDSPAVWWHRPSRPRPRNLGLPNLRLPLPRLGLPSHSELSRRRPQRLAYPALANPVAPFASGFALAACLALAFLLPQSGGLSDAVVSDHIHALQPGHLMDVVSTDQHTVKPWFDGRLAFAPPVKDLKTEGFPLAGGRLDYLSGRTVVALIYQRRQHVIDLYVWPDDSYLDHGPTEGSRSGYNYVRWIRNGMAFWAVSDLAANELADFAGLLRTE